MSRIKGNHILENGKCMCRVERYSPTLFIFEMSHHSMSDEYLRIINLNIETVHWKCLSDYNRAGKKREKDGDHVEELVDVSSEHQEMQDCSLLSFHQSREMGFGMLSWLPLDP
jgi:hypothetical protein